METVSFVSPNSLKKKKTEKKKEKKNRLHYFSWLINLQRFQGARPHQVRVESSCCISAGELMAFVPSRSYGVLTHGI